MKAKLIIRYSKLGSDHLTFEGGGGGCFKKQKFLQKFFGRKKRTQKMLKTVILSLLKESFNF